MYFLWPARERTRRLRTRLLEFICCWLVKHSMTAPVWKFEHSAECEAPRAFVWNYWTDVRNWDDPPATFELHGTFSEGTRLFTILPDQRLESVIREVHEEHETLIEMEVAGAVVGFCWKFADIVPERRTRLTQSIVLSGAGADGLKEQAKVLGENAPAGMKKLVQAIERSWRRASRRD
jgi:hypothetical protein